MSSSAMAAPEGRPVDPQLGSGIRPGSPFVASKAGRALAVIAILLSAPVCAQTEGGTGEAEVQPRQDVLSTTVLRTATAIDNFFSTEEYDWQTNKTRVTVRGNLDWVDEHGTDFNPQVKIHLSLPGLNDRLQLIVNDEDDDTFSGGAADEDESNLSLRYILREARNWGLNFDLGLSTRGDPTLQGFGRANLFRYFTLGDSKWGARAVNRLYWYTDSHWRNDFRWYFERPIGDNMLFRSRTRFDYQEDKDDNILPDQQFTLYHQINDRTAMAYDAIAQKVYFEDSVFDEDEILDDCEKCVQYQLRVRFRRNVAKFPRFFYEIWPIAAWAEQRDYEFTPAVRLRLEVVLGDIPKSAAGLD